LYGLTREAYFPENPRPVAHIELAQAIELQREALRAQITQQSGLPKDFAEFHQWFPDYVYRWVRKHAATSASEEDIEDWTQDLLIHLSRLPLTTKYREAGKKDIVETFDPLRHYGANEARFRNYINLCLANEFRTMHSKRMKDALCRPGNLSLGGEKAGEDPCDLDKLCRKHSLHLRAAQKACQKQSHDRAFLQEFLSVVRREDVKALPTIEALMTTGTRGEAAYWLGVAELEFDRMHTRVKHLGKCFLSGEAVPGAVQEARSVPGGYSTQIARRMTRSVF
jgi:hypothetical protein